VFPSGGGSAIDYGEPIGCFNSHILKAHGVQSGFFRDTSGLNAVEESLRFVQRGLAEEDLTLKQLVSYPIIRFGAFFLAYKRASNSDEIGLRGKYSLGIGGHVNESDKQMFGKLASPKVTGIRGLAFYCAVREIEEEIGIRLGTKSTPRFVGVINDESDNVGKKHFGIVMVFDDLVKPYVRKVERSIEKTMFCDVYTLIGHKREFERWSQMIIDTLSNRAL
jgi:predicted NUDIX family phosphoesterase